MHNTHNSQLLEEGENIKEFQEENKETQSRKETHQFGTVKKAKLLLKKNNL